MQFFRPLDPRKGVLVDREWLRVLPPKCSLLDVSPPNLTRFLTLSFRPAVIGMLDDPYKPPRVRIW